MLQEATKILNSAFHNSFTRKLAQYLHDCVREEVKSSTFRNLKQDKDNKWIFLEGEEQLFVNYPSALKFEGSDSLVTELMLQTEMGQKDRYLIYGYLFLVGKNSKSKKKNEFLTPLLYAPCKLERNGMKIDCVLQDEVLSVNTGALASLIGKAEDEEQIEQMLEGLIDVVPELPLNEESLQIFLTTLKSLLPDIEFEISTEKEVNETVELSSNVINSGNLEAVIDKESEEDDESENNALTKGKISLTMQSAIILTKRPAVTAGVLHELVNISEQPSGVFRETSLGIINEEYIQSGKKNNVAQQQAKKQEKEFTPITVLKLSDSQEQVIKKIENNTMVAVYGPPGTGKTQTIVNLVSHLIANDKTVLVVSRMDKAVDVVAEKLNSLGAEFVALRAGRPNYQKQLNFKLQDLLSDKIDLDTGYENSILVSNEDMKNLLDSIKELEDKVETILDYEKKWYEVFTEMKQKSSELGELKYFKKDFNSFEISQIGNVLESLELNFLKTGLLNELKTNMSNFALRRIMNLSELKLDYKNIERFKSEFEVASLKNKKELIEIELQKEGNIHQISEQIKVLRRKQKTLAENILRNKRRESLKDLLRDHTKKQRLIVHSKALIEKKKNLQSRLLEEEDFKPLLNAFPCWCITSYAVSGVIPLKPGIFDVVIIDEASQCDIASCFPLLYRAKKAVIVGDDRQLPHLSFLEKTKEQSFLSQYEIPDKYQLMWRFRTNSMFDLAQYYSTASVLLDEHFRSYPAIIEFSNKEFYGGRMKIMNKNPKDNSDVLELCTVTDGKVDLDTTRNAREVEAVLKKIHELTIEHDLDENPPSIGVISPFRGQVDAIKKAIFQLFSEDTILRYKIDVGTAHTFQGDERDIMLLSWTLSPNSFNQSQVFLQKPNLFNVAVTRARKKSISFISKPVKDITPGLLREYLEYIENYKFKTELSENYKNKLEKLVAQALISEGFEVSSGVQQAGYNIDLLLEKDGKTLIVECDGLEDKVPFTGSDVKKQAVLERCGYTVMRVSAREWDSSSKACVNRIKGFFEEDF